MIEWALVEAQEIATEDLFLKKCTFAGWQLSTVMATCEGSLAGYERVSMET